MLFTRDLLVKHRLYTGFLQQVACYASGTNPGYPVRITPHSGNSLDNVLKSDVMHFLEITPDKAQRVRDCRVEYDRKTRTTPSAWWVLFNDKEDQQRAASIGVAALGTTTVRVEVDSMEAWTNYVVGTGLPAIVQSRGSNVLLSVASGSTPKLDAIINLFSDFDLSMRPLLPMTSTGQKSKTASCVVQFMTPEEAQRAVFMHHNSLVEGQRIFLKVLP